MYIVYCQWFSLFFCQQRQMERKVKVKAILEALYFQRFIGGVWECSCGYFSKCFYSKKYVNNIFLFFKNYF